MGSRVQQHRPKRETDAKEKTELKQENRSLRKQLTRLRKQVQKLTESQAALEATQDNEGMHGPLGLGPLKEVCEKCGSVNVSTIDIPTGKLMACRECKFRKKI